MMEWLEEAECKGKHMDLWFPPQYGEGDKDVPRSLHNLYYDVARLVCDRCPIREECDVLGTDEEYGMWGGRSPHERRKLSSYVPPKKTITAKQVRDLIPNHNRAVTLDIKPLRTSILAAATRRQS